MKQDNRVLSRTGARELTHDEAGRVFGAVQTQTVCSHHGATFDNDVHIGECGR